MSSVSASNLVVTRSGYPAIADGTFDLPDIHCTLVTGANGSGKTTLLKAIAGVVALERGSLSLTHNEETVSAENSRELRRSAIYVGHSALFMRHINVIEHLELSRELDKTSIETIPKYVLSVDEAIDKFDLSLRKNVRVQDLSAGQQRRLHLASALVRKANLLCIDEPHASLDEKSKKMFDDIVAQQFEAGRTFIIATHDPLRLRSVATHEIQISSGVAKLKKTNNDGGK